VTSGTVGRPLILNVYIELQSSTHELEEELCSSIISIGGPDLPSLIKGVEILFVVLAYIGDVLRR
jgi:hypothetical protein